MSNVLHLCACKGWGVYRGQETSLAKHKDDRVDAFLPTVSRNPRDREPRFGHAFARQTTSDYACIFNPFLTSAPIPVNGSLGGYFWFSGVIASLDLNRSRSKKYRNLSSA